MTTSEHTSRIFPQTPRDWSRRLVSSNGARPRLRPGRTVWGHLIRHRRELRRALCLLCLLLVLLGPNVGLAAPAARNRGSAKATPTKSAETDAKPNVKAAAKTVTPMERLSTQYQLNRDVEEIDGRPLRRRLLKLLARDDVRHFLAVIREAEGGEPDIMVGGCRAPSLRLHPALTLPRSCRYCFWMDGRRVCSSASGNFQITWTNWSEIAPFLGVKGFSETEQALVALELIRRGGGAADATTPRGLALKRRIQRGFLRLVAGDVNSALCLASYDWASSSCSTLPSPIKVDYAELSGEMRKKAARKRKAPQSDDGAPAKRAREAR